MFRLCAARIPLPLDRRPTNNRSSLWVGHPRNADDPVQHILCIHRSDEVPVVPKLSRNYAATPEESHNAATIA